MIPIISITTRNSIIAFYGTAFGTQMAFYERIVGVRDGRRQKHQTPTTAIWLMSSNRDGLAPSEVFLSAVVEGLVTMTDNSNRLASFSPNRRHRIW
jgi:hypothetical protein